MLVEVAIVVIGILIALGLDQLVGNIRDWRQAQQTGATLTDEIQVNLGYSRYRLDERACVARRLDEIDDLLARWSAGEVVPPGLWIGRPTLVLIDQAAWKAAVSAGRVTLFPEKLQAQAGRIYASLQEIADAEQAEQLAWAQLRALERGSKVLTDGARPALVAAAQTARYKAYVVASHSDSLIEATGKAGLHPIAVTSFGLGRRPVCVAMNTPRAAALALIGRPYEEPR